jgi:hypothetical protein
MARRISTALFAAFWNELAMIVGWMPGQEGKGGRGKGRVIVDGVWVERGGAGTLVLMAHGWEGKGMGALLLMARGLSTARNINASISTPKSTSITSALQCYRLVDMHYRSVAIHHRSITAGDRARPHRLHPVPHALHAQLQTPTD